MTGSVKTEEDAGPTDCWQICPRELIDCRDWGDEFVVRMAGRAETHLLSAAAGSVLLAFLDGYPNMSIDSLFARAFDEAQAESKSAMSVGERAAMQAIVAELERLGLVARSTA